MNKKDCFFWVFLVYLEKKRRKKLIFFVHQVTVLGPRCVLQVETFFNFKTNKNQKKKKLKKFKIKTSVCCPHKHDGFVPLESVYLSV
jgi:hypothetical protein